MLGTARTAIIAALSALAVSCGGADGAGTAGGAALRIHSAEWRALPEPRVVVSGEWSPGISTPPSCSLLEDGEPSHTHDRGNVAELDGSRFRQGLTPAATDPRAGYRVRCRVSMSTGKTIEATAPVAGSVPGSQQAEAG